MSKAEGSEGFLSRWSKRKAELRQQEQKQPVADSAPLPEAEEEIDLATLPSIDSLTNDSDFSLFLRKGVPLALRNAALRKLWLLEPSVVNYKALVEYNWDFTAPGYGELLPTDNVAEMAKQVFSGFSQLPQTETAEPAKAEEAPPEPQQALPMPEERPLEQPVAEVAPVESVASPVRESAPQRRRHGGALPT
ncbi:DUF3306 domain-containing protein [Ferrovibrio sp.]|uniref:DUF3306 domain-containing protein n=1 Tax=Ferrovibrio sp. TaxID=1917215 RepID=UPI003D11D75B